MLPAALKYQLQVEGVGKEAMAAKLLSFSRGLSLVLLMIYIAFMIFQLGSHSHIFQNEEAEEEEEDAIINVPVAVCSLIITTILIGISAEYLVGSIEGLAEEYHLSETFIGLIVLPIVGKYDDFKNLLIYSMI